jgi:hypothetical protein
MQFGHAGIGDARQQYACYYPYAEIFISQAAPSLCKVINKYVKQSTLQVA